jgi:hypothetical protein
VDVNTFTSSGITAPASVPHEITVGSYFINGFIAKAKYAAADKMNFEAPLTSLVWLTSIISITATFIVS